MIYGELASDLPHVVHQLLMADISCLLTKGDLISLKLLPAIQGETASSQELVLPCADFCSDFQ